MRSAKLDLHAERQKTLENMSPSAASHLSQAYIHLYVKEMLSPTCTTEVCICRTEITLVPRKLDSAWHPMHS
jgi:hypothetical protein